MSQIKNLESEYVKAANALNEYRRSNGFNPGVKVLAQFAEDAKEKYGVIAPYGNAWKCSGLGIPVLFPGDIVQQWPMSSLTIVSEDAVRDHA